MPKDINIVLIELYTNALKDCSVGIDQKCKN